MLQFQVWVLLLMLIRIIISNIKGDLKMKTFNLRSILSLTMFLLISTMLFQHCSDNPVSNHKSDPNDLPVVTPESVGWSSEELQIATALFKQSGYATVMALYDGKVFYDKGNTRTNYWCHSIRKPLLSALYGIHVENGNIDLDKTLEVLSIDDIPPVLTVQEKQAKVEHLLKSRSGVYHEAAAEAPEMASLRPQRGSHLPNTFFYYNNWDFNVAGTIFEQETGTKIFDEFENKIAIPIGMQDFSTKNCYYYYENEKSQHPAYHFRMSTRDMARFGVLYQKNGMWNDNQIVPEDWIVQSTTAYSLSDSMNVSGYGMMWNVIQENSMLNDTIGYTGYYHTGVGLHALVIIPELKLVVVERYDTDGYYTDPGEIGLEIGMAIINAKMD
jgi:beta-lactamase family protein